MHKILMVQHSQQSHVAAMAVHQGGGGGNNGGAASMHGMPMPPGPMSGTGVKGASMPDTKQEKSLMRVPCL